MKTLVIYYSKTGNTKLMAETMAEELNADLLALKAQKEIKRITVDASWGVPINDKEENKA